MTKSEDSTRRAAVVMTPKASQYLQQLCKHFQHKRPVEFDPTQGHITFAVGECRLDAEGDRLTMLLTSPDEEQMAQLEGVVTRHLVRFAFREELAMEWNRA